MTETWVDHPYRDGLVLIGDAAGASDPTWGQGLSLTSRDVRVLAEKLLSANYWDAAAHSYAEEYNRYFNVTRRSVSGYSICPSLAALNTIGCANERFHVC